MSISSPVQQKDRHFQKAAIVHNHVCYTPLLCMPLLKTDATDIKNETGNSSPTRCSKVKQLETSTKKRPCFYFKKRMFTAMWWKKPNCLEQDLVLLMLLLYSTRSSRDWAECRAPCPNPAHTRREQLLPHQLTSAQTRQKKTPRDGQSWVGKIRQAHRAEVCKVPSLTK